MITVYNIRGTNGSGKTTLARSFVPQARGYGLRLAECPAPTKKDPGRVRNIPGRGFEWKKETNEDLASIVVGSYDTACGGLDAVPDFDTTFRAVRSAVSMIEMHSGARHKAVVAEGILASTVWGSWGRFDEELKHLGLARVAFCYLDTPVEVCLARIRARQEAAGRVRNIKEDLVADKVKAIRATRVKALAAGALVYDLPYESAETALRSIMTDGWSSGPGHPASLGGSKAREMFSARA